MDEQQATCGVGSSVDPDHMSIDDQQESDPKRCLHCGAETRLELGHVEYAEEVLGKLKKLMPQEDFRNVELLVENSRTRAGRTSLFKLLKYILRAPDKEKKAAAASSSCWYLNLVKVLPVVTGRTCGADEAILKQVKKVGLITNMETTTDQGDCDIIILFCPIASRVGTDVDAAMRKVPGDRKVILVLMHHTRQTDYSVDEKKRWSEDFKNIVLYVHVFFHETLSGLLECKRNEEAVKDIRDELKKRSKNRLF